MSDLKEKKIYEIFRINMASQRHFLFNQKKFNNN